MVRWTYGFVNRLVRANDIVLFSAGAAAGPLFLGPDPLPVGFLQVLVLGTIGAAVFGICTSASGIYWVERYLHLRRTLTDWLVGLIPAFATMAVVARVLAPGLLVPDDWLVVWALAAMALLATGRLVVLGLVWLIQKQALLRRTVVVIGTGEQAERVIGRLTHEEHGPDYDVIGVFDDRDPERRPAAVCGVPVRGSIDALTLVGRDTHIDLIVICLPWDAAVRIYGLLERLQKLAADIVIPLDETSFNPRFAQIIKIAGSPSLQVMYQPLKGTRGLLKLVEDYVVALVGLALVWPVLVAAAIAIRLDSRGPVLFRQARVGFNNKPFNCYKFRTITVDPDDDGSVGTTKDNPRITKVGAFLRRSSIDELPQLFNVMRGEMSIVGPRPHVPNMQVGEASYYQIVWDYAARYRVKPGITGWAQVNGMRGGIHTADKARTGVDLDIYYIENWSLWFDFKIMLKTVVVGMVGRDVF